MAVSIDHLDALTNKHFIPNLVDQIFKRSMFLKMLKENEETFDGGRDIRQPVSYKKAAAGGAWSGGMGTMDSIHTPHTTQAVHSIAHYYTDITIPETEQALNQGKAKLVDMLSAQTELSEATMLDTMGMDAFKDGSNNADGYKTLDGLAAICTFSSDPAPGAYGGIGRSANTWWRSQTFATNANSSISFFKRSYNPGNTTTVSIPKMQSQFGLVTDGTDRPDLIITGQLVFDAYHALGTNIQRQVSSDLVGKLGFQTLEFNGVPVVVDDLIENEGDLFMLNMKHIRFRPAKSLNFKATKFRSPVNQLVNSKKVVVACNITCDKPRLQSLQSGFTG